MASASHFQETESPMLKNFAIVLGLVIGLSACMGPYAYDGYGNTRYGYDRPGNYGYGYYTPGYYGTDPVTTSAGHGTVQ